MLVTILLVMPRSKHEYEPYCISVISKKIIGQAKRDPGRVANPTTPGHIARNELDSHADTCCAGANWTTMLCTGKHFEVSPFLSTYDSVQEIPIAPCCTVWTSDEDKEYLLVGNKVLWFGNTLADSLINPNQLREYGLLIKDDSFNENEFGIDADEDFIQFNRKGKEYTSTPASQQTGKRHNCLSFFSPLTHGIQRRPISAQVAQVMKRLKCELFALSPLE